VQAVKDYVASQGSEGRAVTPLELGERRVPLIWRKNGSVRDIEKVNPNSPRCSPTRSPAERSTRSPAKTKKKLKILTKKLNKKNYKQQKKKSKTNKTKLKEKS